MSIGLILGLEREYDKLKDEQGFAGIRTFPIVTIIGFILGSLSRTYTPWLVIIIAAAFLLFLSLSHLSIAQKHVMTGITTNMALFATLILGVMVVEDTRPSRDTDRRHTSRQGQAGVHAARRHG